MATSVIERLYPSYDLALKDCADGYSASDIGDVIAYKTTRPLPGQPFLHEQVSGSLLALTYATADIVTRPIHVLDFGGGCGFHFINVAPLARFAMRWAIVETEMM